MRAPFVVMLGLAVCTMATSASAQSQGPCVKPWAIPDKWIDVHDDPNDGVWTADDTFETVDAHGNALSDPDVYLPPWDPSGQGGFRFPQDIGLLLTLKIADPQDGMKSGFFYAIDIGTAGEGANSYRAAIATCPATRPSLHWGDLLEALQGNLKGPTVQGVADLINLDPNAEWDPVTSTVINSCAPSPECGSVSPRVVIVATFDPLWYEQNWRPYGRPLLKMTNMLGVFIDGVVGGKVTGYLMPAESWHNPQP